MAQAVEVIVSYADQANKPATSTLFAANGLTSAQYSTFLRAAAVIIDAVTAALITGITFVISVDISALTTNANTVTSDVEEVGAFQFLSGDSRPVNLNIPAILDGLSGSGSDDLDQGLSTVSAITSMMVAGLAVTGGTIAPCDVNEDSLVSTVFAREEVRNSGGRS